MSRPGNFASIYRAANATEAHVVRGLFEQHGIEVRLVGEGLSSGLGELPAAVVEVEIHVPTGDRQLARQLIDEYEMRPSAAGSATDEWQCTSCGETNPATFGACWNCQHRADETRDARVT